MAHRHTSVAVHCTLLLILSLHCSSVKTLSVGSQCGGSIIGTCEDGLACVPQTPGSVINVCRESGNSLCDTERCSPVSCDPSLQYTPDGQCCPMCLPPPTAVFVTASLGCTDENVHYNEGETWQRNACVRCTCEEGLVLCSSEQCQVPECDNPVMLPDQCCPTCLLVSPSETTCKYEGETYNNGDSWDQNGDPCVTCFCEDGEVLCAAQSCSVDCENPIQLPNTCCPICPEDRRPIETSTQQAVPLATSLPPPPPPVVISAPVTHCEHGGETYEDGASWNPNGDPCTTCSCSQGVALCFVKSCFAACMKPVHLPGVCCPVCPGEEGYPTSVSTTLSPSLPSHTSHPTPSTTTPNPSPSPRPADITSPTTSSTTRPPSTTVQPSSDKPTPCKDMPCSVEISAVLELDYSQYLQQEELVTTELKDALKELGLEVVAIESTEFGHKQTHVVMSVYSSDDKTLGKEELTTLLDQLKFPLVSSVKIGHHEESKSVIDVSNTRGQPSLQEQSRGPGKTTIIIAVTASIGIAVFSAVVIAVVVTQAWRKLSPSKTDTV